MTDLVGHTLVRNRFFSMRLHWRTMAVCTLFAGLALALFCLALMVGDFPISVEQLIAVFNGQQEGLARKIVLDWRMPRALMALLCGAALGLAGAVFQSVTRNPLGSPDIIGFSAGSYTGALVVIILLSSSYGLVALGALIGGLAAALLVYLLAYRSGVQGFRLIVVGIAVSAVLSSLNTWMMLKSDPDVALSAAVWGAGSLNGVGWDHAIPATIIIAAILPMVFLLARDMRQIELGDDTARALGVPVERSRLGLMALGVALTASVTALAGPISFIALAAPQIARRLAKSQGVALAPSAFVGAVLLLGADLLSQRLFAPRQWPVGIMTVSVGGLYLIWLLSREARRRA